MLNVRVQNRGVGGSAQCGGVGGPDTAGRRLMAVALKHGGTKTLLREMLRMLDIIRGRSAAYLHISIPELVCWPRLSKYKLH